MTDKTNRPNVTAVVTIGHGVAQSSMTITGDTLAEVAAKLDVMAYEAPAAPIYTEGEE